MSFLRANFKTTPRGGSAPIQRRLAIDVAKLAGSIVVFKQGKNFVVE